MPKYDVTVTETKTCTLVVTARHEAEAEQRAIAIAREPGRLDADATMPEEQEPRYAATARAHVVR